MDYDPGQHRRRSIRKDRFGYTGAGGYFVTICTHNKPHLFGTVRDGRMHLNDAGHIISTIWNRLPDKFSGIELNEFVIMPNHLHGIIVIKDNVGTTNSDHTAQQPDVGAGLALPTTSGLVPPENNLGAASCAPTLGDIVGWFKTMTTNEYIRAVKQNGWPPFDQRLWQRNYYERIIHDNEWEKIASYIYANPAEWHIDCENLHAIPRDPEHPWQT